MKSDVIAARWLNSSAALSLGLVIIGCSPEKMQTADLSPRPVLGEQKLPSPELTNTVSWFAEHEAERMQVITDCDRDGRKAADRDCINARASVVALMLQNMKINGNAGVPREIPESKYPGNLPPVSERTPSWYVKNTELQASISFVCGNEGSLHRTGVDFTLRGRGANTWAALAGQPSAP